MRNLTGWTHALVLLLAVVAANVVTAKAGQFQALGLTITAGTAFAGVVFIARDHLQRAKGKVAAAVTIVAAAILSGVLAGPALALASAVAFLVSELLDMYVWTRLEARGYITAATASNTVGSVVDSLLFLWLSGFGVTLSATTGQVAGKLAVTGLVVAGVLVMRARARQAVLA